MDCEIIAVVMLEEVHVSPFIYFFQRLLFDFIKK